MSPRAVRVMLAPLEGVSDGGFRRLCCKLGADTVWTEMVRGKGIMRQNKATLELIDTFYNYLITGIQLQVTTTEELVKSFKQLEELSATTRPEFKHISDIQLNFGCPSPDIIKMGGGPALLKRRKRMQELSQALVELKSSNIIPIKSVGIKIRLGLHEEEMKNQVYMNAVEAANSAGLDYLVIHARHAKQRSSDLPYYNILKQIKSQSTIPVIGNGNIFNRSDALHMINETGVDGIMVARGAMQNPWIFRELQNLHDDTLPLQSLRPTMDEINSAEKDYLAWVTKFGCNNPKYSDFHKQNFNRLRKCIETNNFNLKYHNPSKIYL